MAWWPRLLACLTALMTLAGAAPGSVPPDSSRVPAVADTTDPTPLPRAAVRLQELLVRASRLHDPLSSQTVHVIPSDLLRQLPFDRVTEVLATQAGVVARGEELHVRGGRAGESRAYLNGVSLNEPGRGQPLEMPSLAVREVDLVTGGLDADLGGGLAGVVVYRTREPGERVTGELSWKTDGQRSTHYDQVGAHLSAPLPGGSGLTLAGEATLDDTHVPMLRTESRQEIFGGSFGWRAQNRMLGHAKLTSRVGESRFALDLIANRRVTRPFNPMWSLDGYTIPCDDPFCVEGPVFSPTPQPGYSRYRAADHVLMTDARGSAAVLAWTHAGGPLLLRAAGGWLHASSVTSLDGRDDESYLVPERYPEFGLPDSPKNQPFYVYRGDEPFFSRSTSDQWTVRADVQRTTRHGGLIKGGAGLLYDRADLHEIDYTVRAPGVDSLRAYQIWAPGGYAYAQGRWVFEGFVAHGGLRLEYFDPGPQAGDQAIPSSAGPVWSLSPRLGIAYPVSVRDVFSLSYNRSVQNPERDYLYDTRDRTTNQQPIGRPDLEPATSISYQAAVKHVFDPSWSLQAAVFFRDLYGQVGARDVSPEVDVPQLHYRDEEDASVSGVEVSLRQSGERGFVEWHYTYLEARGSASTEDGVPYGSRLLRRAEDISQHDLDWDRRHTIQFLAHREWPGLGSISWSTMVGSGLPWTPRERRQITSDPALENSERFQWEENTSVAARWSLPWTGERIRLGVEVRNLFDFRSEVAVSADGYPHPQINTVFDDYGAFRTETGHGGGAYWNDLNGDGIPGWIPVHDARLYAPPRSVRMTLNAEW